MGEICYVELLSGAGLAMLRCCARGLHGDLLLYSASPSSFDSDRPRCLCVLFRVSTGPTGFLSGERQGAHIERSGVG